MGKNAKQRARVRARAELSGEAATSIQGAPQVNAAATAATHLENEALERHKQQYVELMQVQDPLRRYLAVHLNDELQKENRQLVDVMTDPTRTLTLDQCLARASSKSTAQILRAVRTKDCTVCELQRQSSEENGNSNCSEFNDPIQSPSQSRVGNTQIYSKIGGGECVCVWTKAMLKANAEMIQEGYDWDSLCEKGRELYSIVCEQKAQRLRKKYNQREQKKHRSMDAKAAVKHERALQREQQCM